MKLSPIVVFFLFVQLLSSQIQDKVRFVRAEAVIEPIPVEHKIKGSVAYQFDIVENVDSIYLDAIDMKLSSVYLNGKKVTYDYNNKTISIKQRFKKGSTHILAMDYRTQPKQTVYFLGWNDEIKGNEQIWTQGQGKYTSHWLPSFDDMQEKVEFDFDFILKKDYTVISNGKFVRKDKLPNSNGFLWQFDMKEPMSSYLAGFVIGNFDKRTIESTSGVPIELYYEPKDSLKVEPTYRHTGHIFDFLEKEIGIPYPWQNYKQVPVQDFLYAGMENTTCTIFSNQYVIDSTAFVDKNYVNVNAHELAHHWFGDLVTEVSGEHHWLQEGFATYYAYLAEKDIFGEDYFYWHLLETAEALNNFSEDDQGEALQNSGAGSLTFYEKGAWALVMLREKVGDADFKKGIKNYLEKYAFKNVAIPDFMKEMEEVSGHDLKEFENTWLHEHDFPMGEVMAYLENKSPSINQYNFIKKEIGDNLEIAGKVLQREWGSLSSNKSKNRLVLDYANHVSPQFLKSILNLEDLKVRQAVIQALEKIPSEIQNDIEGLLSDKSYATLEPALYKLWSSFPEDRHQYLDETQEVIGFPNKNIRLLWLTLALVTPGYNSDLKPDYFNELSSYTGVEYHFETRLLAFQYLNNIGGLKDETIKNLIEACSHHVWHFKKSARNILKEFLNQDGSITRIKSLYPLLNQEEKQYLEKTLGE